MALFDEFNASSQEEWTKIIEKDLRGQSIETLNWESPIGSISPVLFHVEGQSVPSKKTKNSWEIAAQINASSPDVNQTALKELMGGANALEIFGLSEKNIASTLQGIDLSLIHLQIHLSEDAVLVSEKLLNYIQDSYPTGGVDISLAFDPVGTFTRFNGAKDIDKSLNLWQELLKITETFEFNDRCKNKNKISVIHINGGYGETGASSGVQLACCLAHGHQYIRHLIEGDLNLNYWKEQFSFKLEIGTAYFLEIAKIRAFKILWNHVFSAYDVTPVPAKIYASNANLYYSNKDSYNNLLRATTAGMSAVLGGCDNLSLLPHDINANIPSDFSRRISRNIQLLLQEEAYLDKVVDPSEGAYYIESITAKIIKEAWQYFQEIEKSGGLLAAIKSGIVEKWIQSDRNKQEELFRTEKEIMIGVNKFINTAEKSEINKVNNKDLNTHRFASIFE